MYNNLSSYISNFSKVQKLTDTILNKKILNTFDCLIGQITNIKQK